MAESEEEYMDAFAAQCLEHYDCGSSIDSSVSNDIVIWSLTGPPSADYKYITAQDTHRYKTRLQNQDYSKDSFFNSIGTPMSELLKKNFDQEPVHVKQTCNKDIETTEVALEIKRSQENEPNSKGCIATKFINWLERKITAPSRSFIKNVQLLN